MATSRKSMRKQVTPKMDDRQSVCATDDVRLTSGRSARPPASPCRVLLLDDAVMALLAASSSSPYHSNQSTLKQMSLPAFWDPPHGVQTTPAIWHGLVFSPLMTYGDCVRCCSVPVWPSCRGYACWWKELVARGNAGLVVWAATTLATSALDLDSRRDTDTCIFSIQSLSVLFRFEKFM
jgi:hypothetical protein